MDHLLVRCGRRRVLLVDVCESPDGHGVGYGIMLKRIERVLVFGQALRVPVFYVREATHINAAVFDLQSPAVDVLPRRGLRAAYLRAVWRGSAPFRLGRPWLWAQRVAARLVLGTLYAGAERSTRLPRGLRRFILRPRPLYRRLRDANAAYARLAAERWQRAFADASARLREGEAAGADQALRLTLPASRELEAQAAAVRAGIDPARPIVTLHVRESGYRAAAGLRQRAWDELRNARVESYADACRALVGRGYTVVRLGDATMTPLTSPGVVDLAHSPQRTQWLEAWCILRSEFLIGCDSGPSWLAYLAGVPVLTANALHFRDIARTRDRFICKRVRERASGRLLPIAEMLTADYLRTGLDVARYEHLDNEPADLAEAALDMIDVVRGDEEPSRAQRRFTKLLLTLGRELPRDWSGLEGIAFIRRPKGRLSRRFADRYM